MEENELPRSVVELSGGVLGQPRELCCHRRGWSLQKGEIHPNRDVGMLGLGERHRGEHGLKVGVAAGYRGGVHVEGMPAMVRAVVGSPGVVRFYGDGEKAAKGCCWL